VGGKVPLIRSLHTR